VRGSRGPRIFSIYHFPFEGQRPRWEEYPQITPITPITPITQITQATVRQEGFNYRKFAG
jgi:hypothetical protein